MTKAFSNVGATELTRNRIRGDNKEPVDLDPSQNIDGKSLAWSRIQPASKCADNKKVEEAPAGFDLVVNLDHATMACFYKTRARIHALFEVNWSSPQLIQSSQEGL